MSQDLLVAGVDVGGTNIEVGLVTADHQVHARAKTDTPTGGPVEVLDTIATLIHSLDQTPIAVGVGIPGVVDQGQVLTVPNLENWHEHVDLIEELGSRIDLPIALGNDANVGLLGEWVAGAALGVRNVLGLWMGTGIGGGLILDGRPFHRIPRRRRRTGSHDHPAGWSVVHLRPAGLYRGLRRAPVDERHRCGHGRRRPHDVVVPDPRRREKGTPDLQGVGTCVGRG